MVNSILTNFGSLVALQNLQSTQKSLLDTQNRISTGLKVGTAKDDAATWAISTQMKGAISNLQQVSSNLSQTDSVVGTAVSASSSISDLVSQIRSKVTQAQAPGTDKAKVQNDINQLVSQIQSTVDAASFNGINLLNAEGEQRFVSSVVTDTSGASSPSYINVATTNLSTTGAGSLAALSSLNVEDRGAQLLNETYTLNSSGEIDEPVGSITGFDATGPATRAVTVKSNAAFQDSGGAGAITISYKDANGTSKNLTVTGIDTDAGSSAATWNALVVDALNKDSAFSSLFVASTDSAAAVGQFTVQAKDRATDSAVKITGVSVNGALLDDDTADDLTIQTSMKMQFGDEPLKIGEQFSLQYKLGNAGTNKTVILQVADAKNGTVLGTPDPNTTIIAIDAADVSAHDTTGAKIAAAITTALTGAAVAGSTVATGANLWGDYTNFNGAAADGTKINVAVASSATSTTSGAQNNVLTITTAADGAGVASAAGVGATVEIGDGETPDNIIAFTSPQTDYAALLNTVDDAASTVTTASATFGSAQKRIETQKTFVDSLVSNLQAGVGNLVDADMSTESARLTALQVQQQLGTQALSIANQAPQNILSLFQ